VAMSRGELGPALRRWPYVLLFALLEMAGPWLLLADAEQGLSSSLTGLLVATVPLISAVIAVSLGDRAVLRPARLAGLAVGLVGVAFVVGLGRDGTGEPRQVVEVLLVAVGYAIGPYIIIRKLDGVPSLGIIALALAAVALLFAVPALATAPESVPSPEAVAALVGLAVICTGLAFIGFFALIGEVGPTRATLITFVNPAVAITLGVVLLDEPLTLGLVIGFPLVIAGCWMASRRPPDDVISPEPAGVGLISEAGGGPA
jgi:drug/metabolite transporter (DMT)-like permease